jgi:hypothetical protein
MSIREILQTHPRPTDIDLDVLVRCIDECIACAWTCTSCADADLAEPDVQEMIRCIRLCLDCSGICVSTGQALTRQTEADRSVLRAAVEACAIACRVCGDECERHASHHEHCRLCMEECRRCEDACNALLTAMQ